MVSSALRFDIFVHRPQTRSPKATLKFGVAGATTVQQGFDFIVHLLVSGDFTCMVIQMVDLTLKK
jgi:hypothetical protein